MQGLGLWKSNGLAAILFQQPYHEQPIKWYYAMFFEQTWLTNRAICNKTATGFTITFADAAPEDATVDWMLVR